MYDLLHRDASFQHVRRTRRHFVSAFGKLFASLQNKTRRRAKNALRRVSSQQAASRSADGREAFFQIVQNIVDVLQPHGQADKPRRDARGHKLFVGELAVVDRSARWSCRPGRGRPPPGRGPPSPPARSRPSCHRLG